MTALTFMYKETLSTVRRKNKRNTHRWWVLRTGERGTFLLFSLPSNKFTPRGEPLLSVSGVRA